MTDLNNNHLAIACALLRATAGVIFLAYGGVKFRERHHALFVGQMLNSYARRLPIVLVRPFAWLLPFVEVAIGLLLVAGLFTEAALIGSGILMGSVAVAAAMLGASSVVAENLAFSLTILTLLFLRDRGGYSLDHLARKRAVLSGTKPYNHAAD